MGSPSRPGTYPDRLPDDVLARRGQLPKRPDPVVLTGTQVELRAIDFGTDLDGLHAVSNGQPFRLGDRSHEAYDAEEVVWKWMKGRVFRDPSQLRDHLEPLANSDDTLMMTVRDHPTGTPLGIACYMANRPADLKIELGSIWYGLIAQGTGASREATHLMLAHAFALGYRRVEWKCDVHNERSRRSALSYGFTFEGIQEAHMIVKGRSRDTAWYRILVEEWPAVQKRFDDRA